VRIQFVLLRLSVFATYLGLLVGCASGGIRDPAGNATVDVETTIISGNARLTCGVPCSGSWGADRAYARRLYDQGLWRDLALAVAAVGFEVDQTYYYLGRAMEELGYPDAARTYFKLAEVTHL